MKLNHIALSIQNEEELVDFYQNVLGFHLEYQYILDTALSTKLFGVKEQSNVFLYKSGELKLELFLSSNKSTMGLAHICIDVEVPELMAQKSEEAGYRVERVEREHKPTLIFIYDKAGNAFELKNEIS